MFQSGRVNIIVTKHSIRYAYAKRNDLDAITVYGERLFPRGTMKNGEIQNMGSFVNTVKQMVREHRWNRKELAFGLVDDTVHIQDIHIPGIVTESESIQYIQTHVGHDVRLPFENPMLDVHILNQDNSETNVRLFAYPREKLHQYEQAFDSAGLVPVMADLTFLSTYRYYESVAKHRSNRAEHVLLIHWNKFGLYLTAFEQDKAVFNRHIRTAITNQISEEEARGEIQNHISDIYNMIDFYQDAVLESLGVLEEVIICGDMPYLSIVTDELTNELNLAVYGFEHAPAIIKQDPDHDTDLDFNGGKHGRSTRRFLTDTKRLRKYIDLFGLVLKSQK